MVGNPAFTLSECIWSLKCSELHSQPVSDPSGISIMLNDFSISEKSTGIFQLIVNF